MIKTRLEKAGLLDMVRKHKEIMNTQKKEIHNLEQMLKNIEELSKNKKGISLESLLEKIGKRSFGPILLILGLILATPVMGDIPGIPTIVSIFLFLISIQLLFQRSYFWLPSFLLELSIKEEKLKKSLSYLNKAAQYIDKIIKPRLKLFINDLSINIIAAMCVMISFGFLFMEIVPFSANLIGIVLIGFSLSIIANDGLVALLSFIGFFITGGLIIFFIL